MSLTFGTRGMYMHDNNWKRWPKPLVFETGVSKYRRCPTVSKTVHKGTKSAFVGIQGWIQQQQKQLK